VATTCRVPPLADERDLVGVAAVGGVKAQRTVDPVSVAEYVEPSIEGLPDGFVALPGVIRPLASDASGGAGGSALPNGPGHKRRLVKRRHQHADSRTCTGADHRSSRKDAPFLGTSASHQCPILSQQSTVRPDIDLAHGPRGNQASASPYRTPTW
jgi:hypothetical protein